MSASARISVHKTREDAFWLFVRDIGSWWPLHDGYSFGGAKAVGMVMEEREGGRFFEIWEDGSEHEIGRIVVFDPPGRLQFTWRDPDWPEATDVEVRFTAGAGVTLVEVEHRGFTFTGGHEEEAGYGAGWQIVLDRFADRSGGGN